MKYDDSSCLNDAYLYYYIVVVDRSYACKERYILCFYVLVSVNSDRLKKHVISIIDTTPCSSSNATVDLLSSLLVILQKQETRVEDSTT